MTAAIIIVCVIIIMFGWLALGSMIGLMNNIPPTKVKDYPVLIIILNGPAWWISYWKFR